MNKNQYYLLNLLDIIYIIWLIHNNDHNWLNTMIISNQINVIIQETVEMFDRTAKSK